jgi:hypothetical protein
MHSFVSSTNTDIVISASVANFIKYKEFHDINTGHVDVNKFF